jgi:hypothetical protein
MSYITGIVHRFNIAFQLQNIKKGIVSIPFDIVFRTNNQSIEQYCAKNFKDVLREYAYSIEQNKILLEMKRYIKRTISNKDIESIHRYFYDKRWMEPILFIDKITNIELTDYDCKFWTDPNIPFLEIKGIIYFDLYKMLELYFKKKFININKQRRIIKEEVEYVFMKSLPLFLTYQQTGTMKAELLKIFIELINKRSYISDQLEKILKIKKISDYKKEITWKDNKTISVYINDLIKLLSLRASQNIIPLTATGYISYKLIKKYQNR